MRVKFLILEKQLKIDKIFLNEWKTKFHLNSILSQKPIAQDFLLHIRVKKIQNDSENIFQVVFPSSVPNALLGHGAFLDVHQERK